MGIYLKERRKAEIPQDEYTRNFLLSVDQQSKIDVEQKFGFPINYDWHCNTVANCTVEAIISAMNADMKYDGAPSARINFYDVFIAKVTTKVNENAENNCRRVYYKRFYNYQELEFPEELTKKALYMDFMKNFRKLYKV